MNCSKVGFESPVTVAELGISVGDPIAHLLDSHRRIERSLVIVQNAVFSLSLTEPVLRAEAAAALDYELALLQLLSRLHQEDEEKSLFPRLRAHLPTEDDRLHELIDICEAQHREEQSIFEQLAVCLRHLATDNQTEGHLATLETLTEHLQGLSLPHMASEDELIAAAKQHFIPDELRGMAEEMRQRYFCSVPKLHTSQI